MPPRRRTVFLCSRYVILYAERHFTIRIKPKSTSRAWPFDANLQQRPAKPLFAAKCETPLPRLVAPRGVGNVNTSRPSAQCAPCAHGRPCPPLAAVRLRLGNAPPNDSAVVEPTAKPRADKCLRCRHRVNRIISCYKSSHHSSCGQSLLHGSCVVIHIAVGPSSPPIMPIDSALF